MKRITGIGAGIVAIVGLGFVLYGAWTKVQPVTTAQASVAAVDTAKAQADAEAAAKAKAEAEAKAKADAEAAAKVQKESEQIEALAKSLATTYAGHVAMSVIDLDNGAWGGVDMDTPIVSASVYKIFVAYGIYQQIDQGKLTKQSTVKAVGKTVDACLAAMIEVSDNDCGKALGDIAGWQKLDSELHAMGFNATILNNYTGSGVLSGDKQTSPSDVARFMQRLYQGALLSKQSTDDFIAILKADKLNTWLPSGLPSGTVIAHKTGALYNYVHDAGIVYAPKGTYIIVVMTKDWANAVSQPQAVFADISKQFWDYFNS